MWSTKIKQLAKTQTIRDSAASFVGHNSSAVIGAVFFALGFRILGKTDFGVVSLSLATATILKDFSGPAINATLLRLVPKQQDPKVAQGYIHYASKLLTHYYLVLAAVTLVFYHFLSLIIFKQSSLPLIFLTVTTSIGYSLGFLVSGILHTQKKFYQEATFTLSMSVLRLIFLGVIYFTGLISIYSLLIINLAAYFLVSIVGFAYVGLKFLQAPIPAHVRRSTHKFLLPMGISTATSTMTDKINLYITNYFSTLAQVGLLGAVSRLFIPVQQFAGVVSNVFGSRFSVFPDDTSAIEYLKKTAAIGLFMALGLTSTIIIAKPIGLIIYGPDFIEAIPVFRLLILSYSFFVAQVPFSAFLLYYKGRSDIMAKITIFQLLLSVITNIILIPRYQILGAAWALMITLVTNCFVTVTISLRAKTKAS